MRTVSTVILALLLAPVALAHEQTGPAQTHLSVRAVQLGPGENATYTIETGEGPWVSGMVFAIYLQFLNASRNVHVELLFGHDDVIANWTFRDAERHKASALIPFDQGPYEVRVTNLDDEATRLFYYFDQTCNCTMKPMPLDEGWVVFHYDVPADSNLRIGFPLKPGWTVEGVLTTRTGTGAAYPSDFRVIETQVASGPEWVNFTVAPATTTRYVLFLTAMDGSPSFPDPDRYVLLTPLVEKVEGKTSAPGVLAGLLGLVAALVVTARARSR